MTKHVVDRYGWQEACNGIKCSECQFHDVEGRCKFGLYISKQPVYEEEKPKEADNTLGITLRKYLHSLSDTDLSLEEIKVALLMGICKQLDLLKKVDVTKEDIERIRKLGYIPTTIPENELGVRFCCPHCHKTAVYEFSTGKVTKESDER